MSLAMIAAVLVFGQLPPPPEARPVERPTTRSTGLPATMVGNGLRVVIEAIGGEDLEPPENFFAEPLIKEHGAEQIRNVIFEVREQLHRASMLERVEPGATERKLVAVLSNREERKAYRLNLEVDDKGKISSMYFSSAWEEAVHVSSWAALEGELPPMGGRAHLGFYELVKNGEAWEPRLVHGFDHTTRATIGNAVQIFVLGAVAEEIAAGRLEWDRPVKLEAATRSLPDGGPTENEPIGIEHPVREWAARMMQVGDNTAADVLLNLVGKDKVAAFMRKCAPKNERNSPVLSTMDVYRIKLADDAGLAAKWGSAKPEEKTKLLELASKGEPNFGRAMGWEMPIAIDDVGWFFSPDELAAAWAELTRMEAAPGAEVLAELLKINKGLAFDDRVWTGINYRGGGEVGVVTMTWRLERMDGRKFVMVLNWSDPTRPLSLALLQQVAGAATRLLRDVK